ncbi:transcriptional regulator ATRX homolog [Mytilus californianus]|uniref:transcriptional regulator ATRX homolog n=1 Tax=Mytilus californianus TaxID=6549 RepID=UPI002247040F|nr:transcriptional regulator ATRX homolog [Mytilus californianus]
MNSSGHDLKRSGDISYFKNVAKKPKIGPKCMKRQDKDEVKDHKKSKFVIDHKAKVLKLNLSRLDKNLEANETDKEIDKEVTKKLEIINERRKEKSRPKHKEKSESENIQKNLNMDIQKNLNMDNQISINMEIQKSIKKSKEKIPKKYKNFPDKRGSKKGDDDKQIKSPKNLKRKANEEENIASKKSKQDDKTENCDEKKDSIKRPETKMISVEVKKKEK